MEQHRQGTWKEVWDHRRSKTPLLGRVRGEEEGWTTIGISLCMLRLSEGGAPLLRLLSERPFGQAMETGHYLCRLWVAGQFWYGLRAAGG